MLNNSETSQPILFTMLLQLERMFLQLQRHGFLSLMMLIELKGLPRDLNLLTISAMVVGAVEQRY